MNHATSCVCALALLGIAALPGCGGGSAPSTVLPVESITEEDLLAAGVPSLPTDMPTSPLTAPDVRARGTNMTTGVDSWGFTDQGGGRFSLPAAGLPARRILAWALYRVAPDVPVEPWPLSFELSTGGSEQYRVFYAVGNYSRGRWEIGSRILIDLVGAGFSLGTRYASPLDNVYVLVVVCHPGTQSLPSEDFTLDPPHVQWTGPVLMGPDWTVSLFRSDGDLVQFDHAGTARPMWGGFTFDFGAGSGAGNYMMAFPAEFRFSSYQYRESEFNLLPLWGGTVPSFYSGFDVPDVLPLAEPLARVAFFHTNDVNGPSHPFGLLSWTHGDWNGDGLYLNVVDVPLAAGSDTVEVQGILLGETTGNDRVVAPGVPITLLSEGGAVLDQFTTDAAGRFSFYLDAAGGSRIVQIPTPAGDALVYEKIEWTGVVNDVGAVARLQFTTAGAGGGEGLRR